MSLYFLILKISQCPVNFKAHGLPCKLFVWSWSQFRKCNQHLKSLRISVQYHCCLAVFQKLQWMYIFADFLSVISWGKKLEIKHISCHFFFFFYFKFIRIRWKNGTQFKFLENWRAVFSTKIWVTFFSLSVLIPWSHNTIKYIK